MISHITFNRCYIYAMPLSLYALGNDVISFSPRHIEFVLHWYMSGHFFFVVNFAKSLGNSDALARVEKGLAEKPSSSFLASFPRVNKCT